MDNIYTNNKDLKNKYQKEINEIISSFTFQNIYDSIEDVYTRGRYDITPIRFFKSVVPTILNNKIKINSDFSDIIFGFYSNKEIWIKILYKGNEITQHKIPANWVCLPQTNFIPICCLENGDIEIEILTDYDEFYIIYGIFSNDIHEYLINNIIYTTIFNGKKEVDLVYFGKKLYINRKIPDHNVDILKLPLLYIETENYRKYNANKVTEQIREELIEIAMNPNRLSSFMSIDDLNRYNIV
jgi:hypothetical protein